MRSLGPDLNDTNYRDQNIKRMHNLAMYSIAHLEEKQNERTYLDKIKIRQSDLFQQNKPVHIDKLFENEEKYLDQPVKRKNKKKKPRQIRKKYQDEKSEAEHSSQSAPYDDSRD